MTMMVDDAIYTHLAADGALAALVGTRIYRHQLPAKTTLPAVTYVRVSSELMHSRSNPLAALKRPRFQFDVWADSPSDARDAASALEIALATLRGVFEQEEVLEVDHAGTYIVTHDGTFILVEENYYLYVDVTLVVDEADIYEEEPGRWRARMDAFIWHSSTERVRRRYPD